MHGTCFDSLFFFLSPEPMFLIRVDEASLFYSKNILAPIPGGSSNS